MASSYHIYMAQANDPVSSFSIVLVSHIYRALDFLHSTSDLRNSITYINYNAWVRKLIQDLLSDGSVDQKEGSLHHGKFLNTINLVPLRGPLVSNTHCFPLAQQRLKYHNLCFLPSEPVTSPDLIYLIYNWELEFKSIRYIPHSFSKIYLECVFICAVVSNIYWEHIVTIA